MDGKLGSIDSKLGKLDDMSRDMKALLDFFQGKGSKENKEKK
jgi:hypothetical protein